MRSNRLIDFVWLLILAAYILAGTFVVPFHGDEATQIYMSRDYAYQFLQGDLDSVRYHEPPINATEQELRLLNGTLNKYAIGLAWHLGGFSVEQINEQWDWGADWGYNQQNNHAPGEALLNVSRIPSALGLAAGVVVMFGIGRVLGGRAAAYLASLYYALNPALLLDGRRAMMEGSLICFSLLTVLAGMWLLQKRRWWAALVLGVAAGLALASKHTAVFTVAAVFGACAVYPVVAWILGKRDAKERARHAVPLRSDLAADADGDRAWHAMPLRIYAMLAVAGVVVLGVFYALNPAWWGDPVGRAAQVLDLRADLLAGQTAVFGGYTGVGDALGGFFRQVFVNLPQYYEVPAWAGYIAEPIARYEGSIWRGVSVGGSVSGGVVLLALTVIGLWALVKSSAGGGERWVVGLWALAMLFTTALLTPVEWQRYYLPAYPAVGLLAACGLAWLARRLQRRLQP
jgi:hypothetical protein